jgi:nucleotide-binding universal stress UspA family protein
MSYKDILVHVDSTPASKSRLELAIGLARRLGARLSGLHVIPDAEVPPYFKPSAVDRAPQQSWSRTPSDRHFARADNRSCPHQAAEMSSRASAIESEFAARASAR